MFIGLLGSAYIHLAWVGLTDLLLTNQNQWRRTVNARNGFPAGAQGDDTRRRMIELLQACAGDDDLLERLQLVRILPGPEPVAAERAALQALLQALPLAAAQLALVFKARGYEFYREPWKPGEEPFLAEWKNA